MPNGPQGKTVQGAGEWAVGVGALSVYPAQESPNWALERVFDRKVGGNRVFLQFIDRLGALA